MIDDYKFPPDYLETEQTRKLREGLGEELWQKLEKLEMIKTCKIIGCNNKIIARGLCGKHYERWRSGIPLNKHTRWDKNEIIIENSRAKIILYNLCGNEVNFTIIDTKNINLIKNRKWCLTHHNYVASGTGKHKVYLHRLIIGHIPQGKEIDHIDGNPLNNLESNLRLVIHSQNMKNQKMRKNTSSKYKGVSWDKERKKWQAYIGSNNKKLNLGRFDSEKNAALAYDKASMKYFGNFGKPNFAV